MCNCNVNNWTSLMWKFNLVTHTFLEFRQFPALCETVAFPILPHTRSNTLLTVFLLIVILMSFCRIGNRLKEKQDKIRRRRRSVTYFRTKNRPTYDCRKLFLPLLPGAITNSQHVPAAGEESVKTTWTMYYCHQNSWRRGWRRTMRNSSTWHLH